MSNTSHRGTPKSNTSHRGTPKSNTSVDAKVAKTGTQVRQECKKAFFFFSSLRPLRLPFAPLASTLAFSPSHQGTPKSNTSLDAKVAKKGTPVRQECKKDFFFSSLRPLRLPIAPLASTLAFSPSHRGTPA